MKEMNQKELTNIQGGAIGTIGGLLIIAGAVLLAGIWDGFVRPLPCHE